MSKFAKILSHDKLFLQIHYEGQVRIEQIKCFICNKTTDTKPKMSKSQHKNDQIRQSHTLFK